MYYRNKTKKVNFFLGQTGTIHHIVSAPSNTSRIFKIMLFNSFAFILVFLPIVLTMFFIIARYSYILASLWLALSSVFFYGWWSLNFTILLLASICFNYCAGYVISLRKNKKILTFSVISNLLLLCIYKYANFFIDNINAIWEIRHLNVILPIGISFYTFTQIAYLVDSYKGLAKEYNFIHYLLFVTWFPHLIAGPVIHHGQMMSQFKNNNNYRFDVESISVGFTIFIFGLAKKVLIADQFSEYVGPVFDSGQEDFSPKLATSWIAVLSYTLQLYFDFSGYSDMAVGLSRMFNIQLPFNFNSPYKSHNIVEFWRRWHMTLSKFLKDYLYIPLGGNRVGAGRRYFNLFLTMILGGLWHGAGWTFILWGAMHGTYLIINHFWLWILRSDGAPRNHFNHSVSVLLTFAAVSFAWIPFRANDIDSTLILMMGALGFNGCENSLSLTDYKMIFSIILGLIFVWFLPNTQELFLNSKLESNLSDNKIHYFLRRSLPLAIISGLLLCLSLFNINRASSFLYFQF